MVLRRPQDGCGRKFALNFFFFGDGDAEFGNRWSYRDGKIFIRSWRLNDESTIARILTDTTFYSWFAETEEFPLIAELNSDGSVLTLIAEDTGPRCVLRRVKH